MLISGSFGWRRSRNVGLRAPNVDRIFNDEGNALGRRHPAGLAECRRDQEQSATCQYSERAPTCDNPTCHQYRLRCRALVARAPDKSTTKCDGERRQRHGDPAGSASATGRATSASGRHLWNTTAGTW